MNRILCMAALFAATTLLTVSCGSDANRQQAGETKTDAWAKETQADNTKAAFDAVATASDEDFEKEARKLLARPGRMPAQGSPVPPGPSKPAKGEVLYKGSADFTQAQSFEVSFILTADKSEIRDLTIAAAGLRITARHGAASISQNIGNMSIRYQQSYPVQDGKAAVSLGQNGNLSIKFTDGGASGTIAYTYVVRSEPGPGGHPDIPVDFGSSAIRFYRQ